MGAANTFPICMDTFGQLGHAAKKPKSEVFLIVLKRDEILSFMSCPCLGLHFIFNKGSYVKVKPLFCIAFLEKIV